jgi:hypothetical protein
MMILMAVDLLQSIKMSKSIKNGKFISKLFIPTKENTPSVIFVSLSIIVVSLDMFEKIGQI